MSQEQALQLIQKGVFSKKSIWADIGAGAGTFTRALQSLLPGGSTIYALDKSPHMLWRIEQVPNINLQIMEADFTQKMDLGKLDGIIMANALHYAEDKESTLKNILSHLNPGGTFILIEYDIEIPIPTWVPFPISQERFSYLANQVGLASLMELARLPSKYGNQYLYSVASIKL